MVDGKVCSALSNTSSMMCHICKATISKMNDIVSLKSYSVEPETLQFELSVLHAYIRCFECLLHIACRLEVKIWKVTKDKKELIEKRKKNLQIEFRRKMILIVDIPKSGSGTTNDGNTARRFFANPSLSSEITGLSENETKRNEVDEYIDDEESELVEGFEEEIDYESEKCEQNEEEKDDEVEEENDEGVEKAKEEDFKDEQHRTI
ncbi:hypothetical protein QE152_g13470 [Popillia japonica]|uniref:Uncharacterized protein n=1 Tax=Popillia japonica TaxID=7064 RepID=A0AAW1LCU0_POPJA